MCARTDAPACLRAAISHVVNVHHAVFVLSFASPMAQDNGHHGVSCPLPLPSCWQVQLCKLQTPSSYACFPLQWIARFPTPAHNHAPNIHKDVVSRTRVLSLLTLPHAPPPLDPPPSDAPAIFVSTHTPTPTQSRCAGGAEAKGGFGAGA